MILFVALYFAADPALYFRGVVKLVPKHDESRARDVLSTVHAQLLRWLLVKWSLMMFVGVATPIGLWLLSVPLILSLTVAVTVLLPEQKIWTFFLSAVALVPLAHRLSVATEQMSFQHGPYDRGAAECDVRQRWRTSGWVLRLATRFGSSREDIDNRIDPV